ncbi:hypothetical protein DLM_1784 [Aquitalea magnusonii]|uniref:Uncharacterized protein n=2 Tax=Aquitalea magnusonii TaxID=332411 RepID=A0A3G9GBZ6_9NEIS|nr:hypothetical protein DLM_1784 [Aquitalea magnusonii]
MGVTDGLMGGSGDSGGSMWDGWGDVLKQTVGYAAKSAIDAEYNYPHEIAQRQLALQGQDGETYTAGDVTKPGGLAKMMPLLLMAGGAVLLVYLLKD